MKFNIKKMLILSEKKSKSSKVSKMGLIKMIAKTYGNYFFTMQGLKVMKKDDNALVGFGKVLLADKLMDVAQWLAKPEDKE